MILSIRNVKNVRLLKFICLIFFAVTCSYCYSGNRIEIVDSSIVNITSKTSFFRDVNSKYSISSISGVNFEEHDNNYFSLETDINYPIWFKFSIDSRSKVPVSLMVESSRIISLDLYKLNKNHEVASYKHYSALDELKDKTLLKPILGLENSGGTHLYYVRIEMGFPHQYSFFIGSEQNLIDKNTDSRFFGFFFIGALIMLFLYNVILLLHWKSRVYLIYCLYLPFVAVTVLYLNEFPVFRSIIGEELTFVYPFTWVSILPILTLIFSYEYLKFKNYPWIRYIYILLGSASTLIALSNFFLPVGRLAGIFQVVSSLIFVTCLSTGVYAVIKKKENSVIYLLASSMMMFGVLISAAVINGIIPYTPNILNISYYGTLLEVIILSAGLAQSVRREQVKLNMMLKSSNKKFQSLNKSLESFNYHVSHDLKTVLSNITALSEMGKKYLKRDESDKMDEILSRLNRISSNGTEMVNDLLKIAQSEDYINWEDMVLIDIRIFVKDVLENYGLNNKIDILYNKMEFEEIYVHPVSFESVVLNLLTNAVKYSEESPRMIISCNLEKDNYVIKFSDNGIGIDMEKNGNKLFEPFSRIKNSLKKEGTGIGLFMVQKIIRAHNGSIKVDSELGKGTTFALLFPKKHEVVISPL